MNSKDYESTIKVARKIIFMVVMAIIGLWVLNWIVKRTGSFLSWILISLILSFAIEPFVNWLSSKGWRRGPATGLAMISFIIFVIIIILSVAPVVVDQIRGLIDNLPTWINDVETSIESTFDIHISSTDILNQVEQANINVTDFAGNITSNVLGISSQIIVAIFQVLTIGLFTFYLVADGPKFRRAACSLLPADKQKVFLETWEIAIDKTGAYFYSRALMALISAIITYFALSFIGVPFALSLSIWVGFISQFIPTVGTYIASVLPLIVAFLEKPVLALYVLIFIVIYQQIENYYIGPQITARTMQLHPAVALGATILGANLGGATGAVLALPVASIFQVLFDKYVLRYDVIDSSMVNKTHKKLKAT